MIAFRLLVAVLGLTLVTGCARDDLNDPPANLGDFRLGLAVVVTDNMQKVPISREATGEEWQAALDKALRDRFGRYEGDRFYNIGVTVDGYALAPPGVPIVASPKSILVATVAVFDDAKGEMLNEDRKGHQITAFEETSGGTIVGSGLTKTKEEQMESLAFVAVRRIEEYLLANPEWFGLPPGPRDTSAEVE
ncbi:MAG: hypothetical protein KF887_05020 [Paracoccaceae bacterium]|nr:MAG: hypothetical protein KF887_05020 [Paracoccaceae bacterium]